MCFSDTYLTYLWSAGEAVQRNEHGVLGGPLSDVEFEGFATFVLVRFIYFYFLVNIFVVLIVRRTVEFYGMAASGVSGTVNGPEWRKAGIGWMFDIELFI